MLSAKIEEDQLSPASPLTGNKCVDTVGKVVSSIQSLQQRLDDFTVEEIAKAEDRVKTLLFSLTELRQRLELVAGIHQFITASRTSLDEAESSGFDMAILEALHQPLQIHEIAQATKLIRSPSLGDGSLHQSSEGNEAIPAAVEGRENDFTAIHQAKQETAPIVSNENFSPVRVSEIPRPSALLESANSLPEVGKSPFLENQPQVNSIDTTNTSRLDDGKTALLSPVPQFEESNPIATTADSENTSFESQSDQRSGGDFDQQLLDDLIKNYGEFVTFPDPHTPIEPRLKAATDFQFTAEKRPSSVMESRSPPVIESGNYLPPTLRKEGELDLKLKKLIKDYGEYDLYSRESPINLKTGVIGAFILLGAIFSGFYFLSSPKPAVPVVEPAATHASPVTIGNDSIGNSINRDRPGRDVTEIKTNTKAPIKNKK